ncbi:hypothetical protein D3C80_1629300 [compost metagenome]
MLTKSRRVWSQIDSNIKYTALGHSDQFSLWLGFLEMQTAQYILCRARAVVLDEIHGDSSGLVTRLLVGFIKETSLITKYFRFNNQQICNFCFDYIHVDISYLIRLNKYLP